MRITRDTWRFGSWALGLGSCLLALAATAEVVFAQYQRPPGNIVDILDAAPLPTASVSPSGQVLALLERASMPGIAELAQPMHRLAGMRVNPRTNGPHRAQTLKGISLRQVADGAELKVTMPPNPRLSWIGFSPDGTRMAFTHTRDAGIELWVADAATGKGRAVSTASLNAMWGTPCQWLADSTALLCRFVPPSRGAAPVAPDVPPGPNIQENLGRTAPVRTYQDLLASAHDEALFEHYGTSFAAIVDAATGARQPVGAAGLYDMAQASPNGEYLVISRLKRPFSRLVPAEDFPKEVEIWNRRGEVVRRVADLPIADAVPANGVLEGPRSFTWQATAPATLLWAEALDGGDPRKPAARRDRLLSLSAPFSGEPAALLETEYRFRAIRWTDNGVALVNEYDRARRWTRTWVVESPGAAPRKLWDMSAEERYADPGTVVQRPGSSVRANVQPGDFRYPPDRLVVQHGDYIYTTDEGATPQGDRPFLSRVNLRTGAAERVFQSDDRSYETVIALVADDASSFVTSRESATEPPNYFVHETGASPPRAITAFADPAPELRGITKQLLTYARNDGVQLSATLYLPPNHRTGERLPMLVWAYPREFTDPKAASQVIGSPNRFPTIGWSSLHLLFLTQGYAVLDSPTMPIVGSGESANDRYVEQLVASAQAAVDTVVAMGVVDRDRVVAGGHSYGAFMTANLVAHSDIFRAGIARSGAYNRTLTPFGFQNESRTFWEATSVYTRMSPFWYADRIKEPLLIVHGEADDNSGTFPIQSERLYMALKGHGATVRYVTLPHEAHGYAARESVLHTVAEMLNWADTYAKNAGPRTSPTSQR
ncbi:MAG: S9 family peptidase [Vicinamibacterales bacterium]